MKHLSSIDAQLGFTPSDDFSNADGKGAAALKLAAELQKCAVSSLDKKKRKKCAEKRKLEYAQTMAAIEGSLNGSADTSDTGATGYEIYQEKKAEAEAIEAAAAAEIAAAEAEAERVLTEDKAASDTTKNVVVGVGVVVILGIVSYVIFGKK